MSFLAVLKSTHGLTLNVSTASNSSQSQQQDHTQSDSEPAGTCQPYLQLSWNPQFAHQDNNSTFGYHHQHVVTFRSYSVTSLTSRLYALPGLRTNDSANSCILLDSHVVIVQNHYRLSSDELYGLTSSFPTLSSGVVVWLELRSRLMNGSFLHITSQRTELVGLGLCSNDTTTGKRLELIIVQ